MNPTLVNIIMFQLTWLGFVGGAGSGRWWLGLIPLLVLVIWQLRHTRWPRAEFKLMGLSIVLGLVADTALMQLGFVAYVQPVPWTALAPIWMTGLWVGFSLTLNHSLHWFYRKTWASVLFGGLGGAGAYYFAARTWDALIFVAPMRDALFAIGLCWAILMPLLVWVAGRFRMQENPA